MRLTDELSRSLAGLVTGDATQLAPLLSALHHMVEEAARDLPPLLVTAAAASRLDEIGDIIDGTIGREELQSLRASLTGGR